MTPARCLVLIRLLLITAMVSEVTLSMLSQRSMERPQMTPASRAGSGAHDSLGAGAAGGNPQSAVQETKIDSEIVMKTGPCWALSVAIAAVVCGAGSRTVGTIGAALAPQATFSKDIAPIIYNRCGRCHHPNGAGPFSLLTYADAKQRATQMA